MLEEKIMNAHLGGKVATDLPKPIKSVDDLCVAYTPGVALPVKKIAQDESLAFDYTAKGGLVAVVSDGTAILGLGDLGATASIPVMEGKAVLLKTFADVNAWPVVLNHCRENGENTGKTDPQRVIDAVMAIAPMYGGINLEDIASPACFEIEDRLSEMLDIPVFHDDQWGTAVIVSAAVRNYAIYSNKKLEDLKVVISGAGAAGLRIRDVLEATGVKNFTMCDSKGVIYKGRPINKPHLERVAIETEARTIADALVGADVMIGVSAANCIKPEWVLKMADNPAIFAMANPDPEIRPELVAEAFGDKPYVMATGRSDYPNQINNVLCFPFLFRGALDVKARKITMGMKLAAAKALADAAHRPVAEATKALYPNEELTFGRNYIIPKPFDKEIMIEVSAAVAQTAVAEGVARVENFDIEAYKQQLRDRQKNM